MTHRWITSPAGVVCEVCRVLCGPAVEAECLPLWDFAATVPEGPPPKPKVPTCLLCDRELSAHLDAYYGRDLYEKECCRDCRSKRVF